jgi:hypothetical protein
LTVATLILALFLIFPTGWTIRNRSEAVSAGAGGSSRALHTLAHGTYPGFIYKDPRWKYFPYRDDPQIAEYTSSLGNFTRIFWQRFKERPLRHVVWYTFEKPYYIWSWNILQGMGDVYIYPIRQSLFTTNSLANTVRVGMKVIHPFLMAACLGGLLLLLARLKKGNLTSADKEVAILVLVMLYVTLIYTIFACWPRYSVPFRPVFYLVASWSIASLWRTVRSRPGLNNQGE